MESLLRVAAPPSFSHSPASYFTLMSSSHTLMPATILCIHWSLSNFSLFPSGMRSPWNQGHGSSHSLLHPQRPEQGLAHRMCSVRSCWMMLRLWVYSVLTNSLMTQVLPLFTIYKGGLEAGQWLRAHMYAMEPGGMPNLMTCQAGLTWPLTMHCMLFLFLSTDRRDQ